MITEIKGNIFTSKMQTIVNTINCVGVMGAGIAYECRLRYPNMFSRYSDLCKNKQLDIGMLWLYKSPERWILNFPTKYHWKYESKPEYLEKGLQKFLETYQEKEIVSIAFPLLGASNGGIPEVLSLEIMHKYLAKCDIEIEIYHYDPNALDDLFADFKRIWLIHSEKELSRMSGLRLDFVQKINSALENENIRSLSRLLSVKGIGDVTLEKAFNFIRNYQNPTENIQTLF